MLEWIAETLLSAFNAVPALVVAENSPTFGLVRAIYGLLILAVILYIAVMVRPFRSLIGSSRKGSDVGRNHSG